MSKTFSQLRQELNEAQYPSVSSSQSIGSVNPGEKIVGGETIRPPQLSAPKPDAGWGNYKAPKVKPTTLGNVGKSALGAAGRLASKYSPHATALATGYEAGTQLNKISAVNNVTDKVGKTIATGLQKMGIGKSPEVVKAKSPVASVKPKSSGPTTTVPAQSGGGIVTFPSTPKEIPVNIQKTSKPAATPKPVSKSPLPKETPNKITPKGKVTNEPMRKSSGGNSKVIPKGIAPKMTSNVAPKATAKTMPKALPSRKPEADPNKGPGFVTAGISKGPKGTLRPVNITRGKSDATALPHKATSLNQPLKKASNISYTSPKNISAPKKSSPSKAMGTASVPRSSSKPVSGGKWM